jgi:hypothetical protein
MRACVTGVHEHLHDGKVDQEQCVWQVAEAARRRSGDEDADQHDGHGERERLQHRQGMKRVRDEHGRRGCCPPPSAPVHEG